MKHHDYFWVRPASLVGCSARDGSCKLPCTSIWWPLVWPNPEPKRKVIIYILFSVECSFQIHPYDPSFSDDCSSPTAIVNRSMQVVGHGDQDHCSLRARSFAFYNRSIQTILPWKVWVLWVWFKTYIPWCDHNPFIFSHGQLGTPSLNHTNMCNAGWLGPPHVWIFE